MAESNHLQEAVSNLESRITVGLDELRNEIESKLETKGYEITNQVSLAETNAQITQQEVTKALSEMSMALEELRSEIGALKCTISSIQQDKLSDAW